MQATGPAQQSTMTPQQALVRAEAFLREGKPAESEAVCRQILSQRPRFHPALFHLGLIAVQAGKLDVAANMIGKAITIDTGVAAYHRALCEIYRRLGRLPGAIAAGMQAVKLAPRDASAYYNLGLALADSGKFDDAAVQYRKALALNPKYGVAANNLGAALEKAGDREGALKSYTNATELNPRHAEAQNNVGAILSEQGDLDGARARFAASLEGDPHFIHAHFNLSQLKTYKKDDPHLAAMEALLPKIGTMPEETRIRFWFAIAKAWEDTGKYDEAFDAYRRANKLKRATFSYDVKKTIAIADDIISKFDRDYLERNRGRGYSDKTPLFIVGMPRSGTTLIEQILASHGEVFGAGELRDFIEVLGKRTGKSGVGFYMDTVDPADETLFSDIGKAYVERLRKFDANALRVTDKMPGNFFYVGLIHLALPDAKFIYSQRNPMDICLSNYSRLFVETMPFAYDLEELGHYYNCCDRLMEHWKKILPPGTILDFKYEEVVEDLDSQSRRLIDFCGLDWQDSCLEFYKNDRMVRTASIAQVRTPIYKSSVAKWERFRKHLEPLQAIIEKEEK